MEIEPTMQELLMLGMLREWSGKDNGRMVIEFREGAWDIAMSHAAEGRIPDATLDTARGTGKSFDVPGII